MQKTLIINGHQPYDFSEGGLNSAFVERAVAQLQELGHRIQVTEVAKGYDVEAEVARHQWADNVIMQFPVNWMGVPWSFKKYIDEVYTAGLDGRMCANDGRVAENPKANYGTGGSLTNGRYMMSVTFNAPREAFDDAQEPFFRGASVDDMLFPMHLNARFVGLSPLPTFAAFDVMKNPETDSDLANWDAHLNTVFAAAAAPAA
ncbi:NAD(P)H-dependent oxidoreductase [Streptomyces cellostaticus]|uniref:NAD(P)H-dependent oxidoreductase n=1 Tax=Streptomyces cellostaticus TaxID=67285 RepID=UPI0020271A95|nr:NAD(P)H-dependent oxidoreductase [Streptomyces cellostaticus]